MTESAGRSTGSTPTGLNPDPAAPAGLASANLGLSRHVRPDRIDARCVCRPAGLRPGLGVRSGAWFGSQGEIGYGGRPMVAPGDAAVRPRRVGAHFRQYVFAFSAGSAGGTPVWHTARSGFLFLLGHRRRPIQPGLHGASLGGRFRLHLRLSGSAHRLSLSA